MLKSATILLLFLSFQSWAGPPATRAEPREARRAGPPPQPESQELAKLRKEMVENQIKARGIVNEAVLASMAKVQRHEFVPPKYKKRSYQDRPLPIGKLQTISQPYMVALMTQGIDPKEGHKVLEIGTGTGYSAAVLAEIASEVYTIEIEEGLAKTAEERLTRLGYKNVHVKAGDGFFGWEEAAPFDGIIVTCTAEYVPPKLAEQLKEGGRMVIPLGQFYSPQTLVLVTKEKGKLVTRPLAEVQFVPMVGEIQK